MCLTMQLVRQAYSFVIDRLVADNFGELPGVYI